MKKRLWFVGLVVLVGLLVLSVVEGVGLYPPPPPVQAVAGTLQLEGSSATFSGQTTFGQNQPLRSAFGPLRLQYKSGFDSYSDGLIVREGDGNVAIGGNISPSDITASKFTVSGDIRAAQLLDSANSSYFIDPAATGDSLVAAGKVTANSFAGNGSLLTGISGIPAGLVSFFNLSSCPTGWTELTAARGMTIVGLPAAGTLAGTVGTALTNLEDRTHTHTGPSHTHTYTDVIAHSHTVQKYGSNTGTQGIHSTDNMNNPNGTQSTSSTGIATGTTAASGTGATGTAATSNVIPYIQLLACQKS